MLLKERIEASKLYANILEEFKLRAEAINHCTAGRSGLAPPFVKEFCYLQIRMMCELVAMGCLVAHGDIKERKVEALQREWSADRIMNELERLHPNFYPIPVAQISASDGWHLVGLHTPLSKSEFLKLYGKCGDALHRGNVRKLIKGQLPKQINYPEIISAVQPLINLLNYHILFMRDEEEVFLAMLNNEKGKIWVAIAQKPEGISAISGKPN